MSILLSNFRRGAMLNSSSKSAPACLWDSVLCKSARMHDDDSKQQKRRISSSNLTIERTNDKSRFENKPAQEDLQFGQTISDHMLIVEWDEEHQWKNPKIVPYQDLKISPSASCLNYGITCFEGMKAYRALSDSSLRLFRPDCNMDRLKNSMKRLHMPGHDFDSEGM